MLFTEPSPATNSHLLTSKYRPTRIADFRGLVDRKGQGPKQLCAKLVARPFESAWMFVGASGTGKTTLALALASELQAELHHIPSHSCDAAAVRRLADSCRHYPAPGKLWHLIIVDEADQMTRAAQNLLLSHLDGTDSLPQTIWVFTANQTDALEDRFLSRTTIVPFSSYRMSEDATALLAEVWNAEAPAGASAPDFSRIVKDSKNNVRAALMELQKELMLA